MVMFAKRYEDPPAVWGVGRIVVNGTVIAPLYTGRTA